MQILYIIRWNASNIRVAMQSYKCNEAINDNNTSASAMKQMIIMLRVQWSKEFLEASI